MKSLKVNILRIILFPKILPHNKKIMFHCEHAWQGHKCELRDSLFQLLFACKLFSTWIMVQAVWCRATIMLVLALGSSIFLTDSL